MQRIKYCINPTLTTLCKHAIELESLTTIVQEYLPENYRAHCSVSGFSKGCLTLHVKQAGLAAELRYLLPDLRDALRSQAGIHQLVNIKISIV